VSKISENKNASYRKGTVRPRLQFAVNNGVYFRQEIKVSNMYIIPL